MTQKPHRLYLKNRRDHPQISHEGEAKTRENPSGWKQVALL